MVAVGTPVIVRSPWTSPEPGRVIKVTKTSFTIVYDDGAIARFTRSGREWGDTGMSARYASRCTQEEADNLRRKKQPTPGAVNAG